MPGVLPLPRGTLCARAGQTSGGRANFVAKTVLGNESGLKGSGSECQPSATVCQWPSASGTAVPQCPSATGNHANHCQTTLSLQKPVLWHRDCSSLRGAMALALPVADSDRHDRHLRAGGGDTGRLGRWARWPAGQVPAMATDCHVVYTAGWSSRPTCGLQDQLYILHIQKDEFVRFARRFA